VFPSTPKQPSTRTSSPSSGGLLATGHYAQVRLPDSWQPGQPAELWRCPDPVKDQSYFLSAVDGRALSRVRPRPPAGPCFLLSEALTSLESLLCRVKTVFPLGHLHKAEVRELARKFDLPTANRRESMGICFVGNQQSASGFPDRFLCMSPASPLVPLPMGQSDKHLRSGVAQQSTSRPRPDPS
jgi:hypothetical protein